jgi:NAD(P)-dependent dehydrogenase (short-subunit alcohol dehydrogenase family)
VNLEAFRKFDLSGKSAFVTGGGTGLGYYMARGLARSGATVMISARRKSVLENAARLLSEDSGNTVRYCEIDLSDRKSIRRSADYALRTLDGVDIFVGNAGQEAKAGVDEDQDEILSKLVQVNLAANVSLVETFLPHMKEQQWGRLIFSSSLSSLRAVTIGQSIYAASKGAINAYTRMAAAELGHQGITVNSLILGAYQTEMMQTNVIDRFNQLHGEGAGEAFVRDFASNSALGRLGRPEEIEGQIQLLASDAGSYITGTEVVVDGGMSIMMRPNPLSS